jgi:hypothetical protein
MGDGGGEIAWEMGGGDGMGGELSQEKKKVTNQDSIQIKTPFKSRLHSNQDSIQIKTPFKSRLHSNQDSIQI